MKTAYLINKDTKKIIGKTTVNNPRDPDKGITTEILSSDNCVCVISNLDINLGSDGSKLLSVEEQK